MRLNHDCIRDCLLYLEDNLSLNEKFDSKNVMQNLEETYEKQTIEYSLKQLADMGYITMDSKMINSMGMQGIYLGIIYDITPNGHEFLDNIRSKKVWNITKKTIKEKVGNASLGILAAAAENITKQYLGL